MQTQAMLYWTFLFGVMMIVVCCSGKCWLTRPDVLRQPFLISALNALAGRVWTVSTEDWKKFKKACADVHRTVPSLCYICLLGFIAALRVYVTMEKELWVYALACASFSRMQQIWAPRGFQGLSEASEEASAGPHTPDGSQTDKICSDSGPIQHPSLFSFFFFFYFVLPSFHPSVFPPRPLSPSPASFFSSL